MLANVSSIQIRQHFKIFSDEIVRYVQFEFYLMQINHCRPPWLDFSPAIGTIKKVMGSIFRQILTSNKICFAKFVQYSVS